MRQDYGRQRCKVSRLANILGALLRFHSSSIIFGAVAGPENLARGDFVFGSNPTTEVALEPARPIVDEHHHILLGPPVPQFEPYDGEAVLADQASDHKIVPCIYTEAQSSYRRDAPLHLCPLGENEYIENFAVQARRHDRSSGRGCVGDSRLRVYVKLGGLNMHFQRHRA